MNPLSSQLAGTVAKVRAQLPGVQPRLGIVLGSGLGALADALEGGRFVSYDDLPGFPRVSVEGHAGRLWLGTLAGVPVALLQGRAHSYEGYSSTMVAYPARALCALGIEALLVTNSAGGVNEGFHPGDLMVITDHLNLSGQNPLTGPNDPQVGVRFVELTRAYDPALVALLETAAARAGLPGLRKGVYAQLAGPTFETPAEIRMLRTLGADAVGMSTVPEVIVARHHGVRVAGVSCITNVAAEEGETPPSHAEVIEVAGRAAAALTTLATGFVKAFGERPREVR